MSRYSNRKASNTLTTTGIPEEAELQWIARAQGGDRRAFGDIVHHYREGVINVVYRMCGDANLAEDAAQEAFIRAWQNLPRYQPRSPFRNWLYRIATNVALDVLRRERDTVNIDDLPLAASGPDLEATVECNERAEQVRRAVLALAPPGRLVLILREYEGLSYKEIAETLNVPIGTVMSRLNYARTKVREMLAAYLEVG